MAPPDPLEACWRKASRGSTRKLPLRSARRNRRTAYGGPGNRRAPGYSLETVTSSTAARADRTVSSSVHTNGTPVWVMYQPLYFGEDRTEVQHDLIRRHPLGLIVTAGPGPNGIGAAITNGSPTQAFSGILTCWRWAKSELCLLGAAGRSESGRGQQNVYIRSRISPGYVAD